MMYSCEVQKIGIYNVSLIAAKNYYYTYGFCCLTIVDKFLIFRTPFFFFFTNIALLNEFKRETMSLFATGSLLNGVAVFFNNGLMHVIHLFALVYYIKTIIILTILFSTPRLQRKTSSLALVVTKHCNVCNKTIEFRTSGHCGKTWSNH